MLSQQSRPYIEASVPVLREHGVAITHAFYHNMFTEYPELTNLFNMGNQANGAQQQSLASAVFAYAANYENADALAPVVSRIVHKHASVGITAEHYPIVGKHLLGAIQEILGAAATPPLIAAWAEAYGLLASALIEAEKELYTSKQTQPGQLYATRVVSSTQQTELVKSFVLEREDGQPLWDFVPGQYISVEVQLGEGKRQLRQYSLSEAPGLNTYRVSVKRELGLNAAPAGQISNWLHDHLGVGDILHISPPFGEFTPTAGSGPLALISAGVGITPMVSALNHLARTQPQRPVFWGHATRDTESHAHCNDVQQAMGTMPHLVTANFYEVPPPGELPSGTYAGFFNLDAVPSAFYVEGMFYLCGPRPFMRIVQDGLLERGVAPGRIHREVFGPEMLDALS